MIAEKLHVTGELRVIHLNEFKEVVTDFQVKNLVVTTGKNYLMSRAINTSKDPMSHMAIGSGTTSPVLSNTVLENQLSARVSIGLSSQTANNITYEATFAPGVSSGIVTEAGIFNASIAGDMLCRTVFDPVIKNSLDTIIITWVITLN